MSEPETLTDSDWMKIDQKYSRSMFYKWSLERMNIYYATFIAISFVGTLYLIYNFYQGDTKNIKTEQTIINSSNEHIGKNSLYRDQNSQDLNSTNQKNIIKSHPTFHFEASDLEESCEKLLEVPQNQDSTKIPTPAITHSINEVPKKVKIPVLIYQQDTIFELDSTKVSRRKKSRMGD
jgi:hypothetical protein